METFILSKNNRFIVQFALQQQNTSLHVRDLSRTEADLLIKKDWLLMDTPNMYV